MNAAVRVLVVDDDPLVRAGLAMIIGGSPNLTVVGEAGDGSEVAAAVDAYAPDVVLMDIRMPTLDGLAATEQLRARPNPPEVIVHPTHQALIMMLGHHPRPRRNARLAPRCTRRP